MEDQGTKLMVTQGSDTLKDAVVTGMTGSRNFDHHAVLLLDYSTVLYFSCLVAKKKTNNQRKLIKGSIATMMNSSNIFLRLWRRSGHFLSLESLYIRWSRTLNGNSRVIKANQIYFNASTCKTEVTNQASCGREQSNGCNKVNYFAIEFMTLQGFIIIWSCSWFLYICIHLIPRLGPGNEELSLGMRKVSACANTVDID